MKYNVCCLSCGQVFQPAEKSPFWWQAKQAADGGRLDAIHVSGEKCGCEEKQRDPDAPFRILGYNDAGRPFDIPIKTFGEAVTRFRDACRFGSTVFIKGVSERVRRRIELGC